MREYDFHSIEPKWQDLWEAEKAYRTEDASDKPKLYCLDYFPYPSGDGLHVGHCRNYIPTDVISRYYRMKGFNVLHPMGWDAFGLPAENEAIRLKKSPREITRRNTANFKRQLKLLGTSYDWEREINSSDPEYYRWTQWFFLLLYKRGLAYEKESEQWWCPHCKTVLANEQAKDGKCWRCGTAVEKKQLKQWFFKITDYADRLADDLDTVDWPERIKIMQRNWIGKSVGAEVVFEIVSASDSSRHPVTVFTTRLDTIMGATFLVLAPEHPLVQEIVSDGQRADVETYIANAKTKTEIDRMSTEKEKTGVFTGAYAINPFSGEKVPVWIADYVLMGYGTGAIMAVPAHDSRDFVFAKKYGLPIRQVITWPGVTYEESVWNDLYSEHGSLVNSGRFDDLTTEAAFAAMIAEGQEKGVAKAETNYHMRDWLISRQRYWGAPIPMIHCPTCGTVPVPESQLPVLLPDVEGYEPSGTGESPLAGIKDWVETTCPVCGGPARRETDTMDGFACSSWYELRYTSPHDDKVPFDRAKVDYWLPVDLYVGGAEHAVMHLLYSRFWTKVMYDAGLIGFTEPFARLMNQGMLLSYDGQKMSKSRHNVITPDEVVEQYGADTLRLYELFMAPFEQEVAWSKEGISGAHRFVKRLWELGQRSIDASHGELRPARIPGFELHINKLTKKITEDVEKFKFNTAVAAFMEYFNFLSGIVRADETVLSTVEWQSGMHQLLVLLAPFAPHMTEELWQEYGGVGSIHRQPWPAWDDSKLVESEVEVAVQINGKVRGTMVVASDSNDDELEKLALRQDFVVKYTAGHIVKRVVVIKGKIVNIVVQ
ncbi:MAG: leucine--tRNA ligase [Candidatus Cryosericum sp.]|nr:leucine--tRNA ligase [bacterium]